LREPVEARGPEALVEAEPVHRLLHRLRGQPTADGAAGLLAVDQPGLGQHVEVLHDRRKRHRERARELADRHIRLGAEPRQQRAPRRVGKGREGAVERVWSIFNHLVKY
jgi:hypothetical protein